MKVLGVIPSRFGSSRFPGKPLIDIAGQSMIQRVYLQSKKCELIDEVIVATDDDRIYQHVLEFGGKAMMTSTQHENGTQRCGEVLDAHSDFDVVLNIQGDEPLIKPQQLEKVIALFHDETVQIGTLVKKMDKEEEVLNVNRVKVVLDSKQNAIYFSRNTIPASNNLSLTQILDLGLFYKHIGIYAWRIEVLKELLQLPFSELERVESLEQLRWLYNGYKIRVAETSIETPNIDTPEDLEEVLRALAD